MSRLVLRGEPVCQQQTQADPGYKGLPLHQVLPGSCVFAYLVLASKCSKDTVIPDYSC